MRSGSGSAGVFNVLTIFFLLLTVFICLCTGLMVAKILQPPPFLSGALAPTPTKQVIPTETPTNTPTYTPIPTETPLPTSTPIPSRTPTNTPLPTETPPPTETPAPTLPPTRTFTPSKLPPPSVTPRPTRTASPTIDPNAPTKTPPGFPFSVQPGTPSYTSNLNASQGCGFLGVGGQIFGLNNEPLNTVQIAVVGPSFNQVMQAGSNPIYGQGSGWGVQIANAPNTLTYTVEVRNPANNTPLSAKVRVSFPGSCDKNLALLNFKQTRPY